jgi:ASC-1-like (ASCH) protein
MQEKQVKVGDSVTFINALRKEIPALVTAVWSPTCINVVLVSEDVDKTDTYGRQIERNTSVMHKSCQGEQVYGMVWY